MRKKGALFYIIDAFVAASIIAMTMTIIFATQLNVPKAEAAEDSLDNYLTYLQKTSIFNAPGTTKTIIIEEHLVDSSNDNLVSTFAQLIQRGNITEAQNLLLEVNQIALETQYGVNVTITIDDIATNIMTRNLERREDSKIYLQKSILSTYQLKPVERAYNASITTTGNAACGMNTCLYTMDASTDPITFNTNGCGAGAGLTARCYEYNQTSIHIIILEVSTWS